MAKSTQKQFIDLCQEAADYYDRELVVDYKFTNVGSVSMLRRGTMEVLFDFDFNFQSGMTTFSRLPMTATQRMSADKQPDAEYFSNRDLPQVIQRVRNGLAAAKMDDEDLLTFDQAEAAGLDGTGRDGDPNFPHRKETDD